MAPSSAASRDHRRHDAGAKPLIDSRIAVARAIDGVEFCVEAVRTQQGSEFPMT